MEKSRRRATIALALLVPAPSIGAWIGLHLAPGPVGGAIWAISKLWLVIFPALWWKFVDRRPFSASPVRKGGLGVGLITGVVIAGAIILGGTWGGSLIDPAAVRDAAEKGGFATPAKYLALVAYLSFVNALLEEYVWRWFVFVKSETLFGRRGAVVASGFFFTIHHWIALAAYSGPSVVLLGGLGVFIGGVTWSALYLKYRSVWPGYLSHIAADLAIFWLGWGMIFS